LVIFALSAFHKDFQRLDAGGDGKRPGVGQE
jgi:hypothetical protein